MRSAFVKIPKENRQTLLNLFGDARREQGGEVKGIKFILGYLDEYRRHFPFRSLLNLEK